MDHQIDAYSPILFVTGTGRSGTNITKKILSKHSHVASLPFEHRFTIDPQGVVDFYKTYPAQWSPYWCDFKVKAFTGFLRSLGRQDDSKSKATKEAKNIDPTGLQLTPPAYAGWELEQWFSNYFKAIDELEQELIEFRYRGRWPGSEGGIEQNEMIFANPMTEAELQPILARFLQQLTSGLLSAQGKQYFVEDNTHSILNAKALLELYPAGKILHIVRDPRDVIASLDDQSWTPSHSPDLIHWYKQIMDRWLQLKAQLDVQRVLEVRLEDIVQHTQQTLENICDFAGIPFEKRMMENDLTQHHSGRYASKWNAEQIAELEDALSPYMKRWGYPLT